MITASGRMLDLRLRVVDPGRAKSLLSKDAKAVLIHEATGRQATVAVGSQVGELRQYAQGPVAGRVYFILFANPEHLMRSGDRATVSIGDLRVQHLTVE
jgi:hypothetical protein